MHTNRMSFSKGQPNYGCHLNQLLLFLVLYLNEVIADAPEAISDAGLLLAQPVVIRDTHIVHVFEESIFLCNNQVIKAFRTRFLHTF